jgi:hypothetical protein
LSPFFTKSNYDCEVLNKRLQELDQIINCALATQGGEVDATTLLVRLTIDIFGEAAFGIDMKGLSGPEDGKTSLGRIFLEEVQVVHQEMILRQSTQPWQANFQFLLGFSCFHFEFACSYSIIPVMQTELGAAISHVSSPRWRRPALQENGCLQLAK